MRYVCPFSRRITSWSEPVGAVAVARFSCGTVVLVPQETRATATAPTGSDQVVMRLEKGQKYRIQGLKVDAVGDALVPDDPSDP